MKTKFKMTHNTLCKVATEYSVGQTQPCSVSIVLCFFCFEILGGQQCFQGAQKSFSEGQKARFCVA